MGLQKELEFDNGILLSFSYTKIVELVFNYTNPESVQCKVNIYKDINSYNEGKPEVRQIVFLCQGAAYNTYMSDFSTDNPRTCAYNWLKTLPLFSEAIDI
jgi:hypothetical protein